MKMYSSSAFRIAAATVFAALVAAVTYVTTIPLVGGATFNLGEALIYSAALLLGPFVGAFAGVGAVIADISLAPSYVPVTPFIKAVEGFLVGYLIKRLNKRVKNLTLCAFVAILIGGFEMVGGYFVYEVFMWGYAYALGGLLFNIIQMLSGLIIAIPVMYAVLRVFPQLKIYL